MHKSNSVCHFNGSLFASKYIFIIYHYHVTKSILTKQG